MAGSRPNFSQFIKGGSATNAFPGGMDVSSLLAAMSQPGAFTGSSTSTGELTPGTPSTFSDIVGMALLGQLVNSAFGEAPGNMIGSGLSKIFGGLPGLGGLGKGDAPTDTSSIGALLGDQAPTGTSGIGALLGSQAPGAGWNFSMPDPGQGYSLAPPDTSGLAGFNWGY